MPKRASRQHLKLANFDDKLRVEAGGPIVGIDEAGRGPLAGPVCAAAVIFPPNTRIKGIDDSKKLNASQREEALAEIGKHALAVGVALVGAEIIDTINIYQATIRAAKLALAQIKIPYSLLMTDYLKMEWNGLPVRAEARADARSLSVAAASIVAKTTRDRLMIQYAEEYPGYALERNKGYGSPDHLRAIEEMGPTTLHRSSFAGVCMFEEELAPSRSFRRLSDMRNRTEPRAEFIAESNRLLKREECPLVDRECSQVLEWIREIKSESETHGAPIY